jgi:nitroimidazol reductase NimA-like FMN-containing flavoprotein (pyridoxamine 5'-phosphate oxidase superfamily)
MMLSESEARALLERNHLGRLSFIRRGAIDVEVVHYVASGIWLLVRSANGTEIDPLADHPNVALQVDEIDGVFDWRSVVVHGTLCFTPGETSLAEKRDFDETLRALRSLIPQAVRRGGATPFRRTVYAVRVDILTGRKGELGKMLHISRGTSRKAAARAR